eukprot:jgi/Mesvir1/4148/Mv02087-RA.1
MRWKSPVRRQEMSPPSSKVLVPREFLATVHAQFVEIKDTLGNAMTKYKNDKDAARKRHARAKNKLVKQKRQLQEVISQKEADIKRLEMTLRSQNMAAEKWRTQLDNAQRELVIAKSVTSMLLKGLKSLRASGVEKTPPLTDALQ